MKNRILISLLFIGLFACKTPEVKEKEDLSNLPLEPTYGCCSDGVPSMLAPPINSSSELGEGLSLRNVFDLDAWKDEAAYIEIDKHNPLKETLWFVSSRDTLMTEQNSGEISNHYTQIYSIKRELDPEKGYCPSEGWDPNSCKVLEVTTVLGSKSTEQVRKFNDLNKGSVWIVGDTMFISAQKLIDNAIDLSGKQYLNIWTLTRQKDGSWDNPNQILEPVSQELTWESHPTVSSDGRHMFFTSTRINADSKKAKGTGDIYYSYKEHNGKWTKPKFVSAINTEYSHETPRIDPTEKFLMYASQKSKDSKFQIYQIDIQKREIKDGSVRLECEGSPRPIEEKLVSTCDHNVAFKVNDPNYNQRYPFWYNNPTNKYQDGRAFLWSHDKPVRTQKFYDEALNIYGCAIPSSNPQLEVVVMDVSTGKLVQRDILPVIEIEDANGTIKEFEDNSAITDIDFNTHYKVRAYTEAAERLDYRITCNKQENSKLKGYFPYPTKTLKIDEVTQTFTRYYPDTVEVSKVESIIKKYPKKFSKEKDTVIFNSKVTIYEDGEQTLERVDTPDDLGQYIRILQIKEEVNRKWEVYWTSTKIEEEYPPCPPDFEQENFFSGKSGIRAKSELTLNDMVFIPSDNPVCRIKDTIWVAPCKTELPDCVYEFADYFSRIDSTISFFQTGYWEVNTSKNFSKHINLLNNFYSRPLDFAANNIEIIPPEAVSSWDGAKWIELHPRNTTLLQKDSAYSSWVYNKYYSQSRKIDTLYNYISNEINKKLIPAYELIYNVSADSIEADSKFVLSVEAWSDIRHVNRGWYWPKNKSEDNIAYASGSLQKNAGEPGFRLVSIDRGDELGKYNHVLSGLRAYFGYKELINFLNKNNSKFAEYYSKGLVLDPEELIGEDGFLLPEEKISEIMKQKKILILARGYSTLEANEGFKNPNDYHKSRKIRIVAQNLQYIDGQFGKDDGCCNDKDYKITADEMMQKLDPLRVEDKEDLDYIISFGAPQSKTEAENLANDLSTKSGVTFKTDVVNIVSGKKYRVYLDGFKNYKEASIEMKRLTAVKGIDSGAISLKSIPLNKFSIDAGKYIAIAKVKDIKDAKKIINAETPKIELAFKSYYETFSSLRDKKRAYNTYMILPRKPFLKTIYDADGKYQYTLVLVGPYSLKSGTKDEAEDVKNKILKNTKYEIFDMTSTINITFDDEGNPKGNVEIESKNKTNATQKIKKYNSEVRTNTDLDALNDIENETPFYVTDDEQAAMRRETYLRSNGSKFEMRKSIVDDVIFYQFFKK